MLKKWLRKCKLIVSLHNVICKYIFTQGKSMKMIDNIYNNKNLPVKGHALLAYLTRPFFMNKNNPAFRSHTNIQRSLMIVKVLNELGYVVDVVDWDNLDFVPEKKYDLFIGHGGKNFESIYKHLNKDAIVIYFSTGSYWKFHNTQEERRFDDLKLRRGVTLPYDRYINESEEFANSVADGIICLGNHHICETYSKFPLVLNLNNASYSDDHYNKVTKNFEKNRKNFLFFSGWGNVHKGLDLLLEVFSKSDKNLYICTHLDSEFKKFYKHELRDYPNIHYVGFIQMRSKKFYNLMDKCNYVIFPSCSEGSPGSVVACLQYGLIPIVSKESNLDVDNYGILLKECSIKDITKVINDVSNKPIDWIREKSLLARKAAITDYSEETFLNNLKNHIKHIIEKASAK